MKRGERARRKRALNIKNDQFVELCVFQFMNSIVVILHAKEILPLSTLLETSFCVELFEGLIFFEAMA